MTAIEGQRVRDLVDCKKAALARMAATSDEKSVFFYRGWTKGELVVHLLDHYWPEE